MGIKEQRRGVISDVWFNDIRYPMCVDIEITSDHANSVLPVLQVATKWNDGMSGASPYLFLYEMKVHPWSRISIYEIPAQGYLVAGSPFGD